MRPIISIIVPIYNVEKYLPKCIDSILNQTFKDFELILVDDGSPDNSGNICDEYAEKDKRVRVIHKKNGGVSSARNAGVDIVLGEYIGFIDPDDYIDKDMYQKMLELCIERNADVTICKFAREINGEISGNNEEFFIKELDNVEGLRECFKGVLYRFSLCNKLFKKKCFREIRFPEGRIHEDLSTTYRLLANADKSVYINYSGYVYVKRENSILTSTFNEKRLQAFIGWNEILEFTNKKYKDIIYEVNSSFCYWCIDNYYYITNELIEDEKRKDFFKMVKLNLNRHYRDIISNNNLSLKNKIIITGINYSVKFTVIITNIKNKIKKNNKEK